MCFQNAAIRMIFICKIFQLTWVAIRPRRRRYSGVEKALDGPRCSWNNKSIEKQFSISVCLVTCSFLLNIMHRCCCSLVWWHRPILENVIDVVESGNFRSQLHRGIVRLRCWLQRIWWIVLLDGALPSASSVQIHSKIGLDAPIICSSQLMRFTAGCSLLNHFFIIQNTFMNAAAARNCHTTNVRHVYYGAAIYIHSRQTWSIRRKIAQSVTLTIFHSYKNFCYLCVTSGNIFQK